MRAILNNKHLKRLRQKLRNEAPSAEVVLWKKLRRRQIHNYKFRRQHSIGPYIVDFYCPELKLVIEIDGQTHFNNPATEAQDLQRQHYIEQEGFTVIRFTNTEIYHTLDTVLEYLHQLTPPQPSPKLGEGENKSP
jgi:very-short-patch-repair endonuclease